MKVKKLDLDLIPRMNSREVRAKRKVLSRTLEGSWTTLLKGRGMEFAGFRKYTYGDDASRIDWGASLRSNETLVREFEEYKNINVLFVLDVSDTMIFTSQNKLKAEYAAELTFNLATAILDNGDSVGYVLFSDKVRAKEMPGIGKEIVYSFANALSHPENYGGEKDFKGAMGLIDAMLKQRSLIILISDFVSLGDGWERYVRMLSEKFDLIGIMLRDPHDSIFPVTASQYVLQDPYSDERILVDVRDIGGFYETHAKEEEAHVKNVFDAAKAGFIKVVTDGDLYDPILHYLRRRTAIIKG